MDSGGAWRLGHRPALDGVRGVAILLVLLEHSGVPVITASGVVGVTLFFVLSGFLISSLLIEEWAGDGRINLKRFYVRRARRLGPMLVTMIIGAAIVGLVSGSTWFFEPHEVLYVVFYVGNWVNAYGGDLGAFSGTWSLAVEEQFYMLWPLLAVVVLRRGASRLLAVALALLAASLLVRVWLVTSGATPQEVYFRTDTTAAGLLLGAALAAWIHLRPRAPTMASAWSGAALACLFVASVSEWPNKAYWTPVLAAGVGVVLVLSAASNPARWLSKPWLTWCGRRSYAMYLWHIPLTRILRDQTDLPWTIKLVLICGWAALASELSWRLVERRFANRQSADVGDDAAGEVDVKAAARVLEGRDLDVVTGHEVDFQRAGLHRPDRR